jgi:hypothetical protein
MLVTIDPLLGEMKAERYSGKTLRSRTIYRIDVMNESITRGRYVLPLLGIGMVLELDRAKGRVTETVGSKVAYYYDPYYYPPYPYYYAPAPYYGSSVSFSFGF